MIRPSRSSVPTLVCPRCQWAVSPEARAAGGRFSCPCCGSLFVAQVIPATTALDMLFARLDEALWNPGVPQLPFGLQPRRSLPPAAGMI